MAMVRQRIPRHIRSFNRNSSRAARGLGSITTDLTGLETDVVSTLTGGAQGAVTGLVQPAISAAIMPYFLTAVGLGVLWYISSRKRS